MVRTRKGSVSVLVLLGHCMAFDIINHDICPYHLSGMGFAWILVSVPPREQAQKEVMWVCQESVLVLPLPHAI